MQEKRGGPEIWPFIPQVAKANEEWDELMARTKKAEAEVIELRKIINDGGIR